MVMERGGNGVWKESERDKRGFSFFLAPSTFELNEEAAGRGGG